MEMLGSGPTQLWDTLQSWFTPTVLFLLLNIVIGTIAVTSRMLGNNNNNNDQNPNALRRAPSLLARLPSMASMNFSRWSNEQADAHIWNEPQEAVAEDNVGGEVEKPEAKMDLGKKRPRKAEQRSGGGSGLSQRTGNVKSGLLRSKSDAAPLLDLHAPPPPLPGKMKKYDTFELTQNHARAVAEAEAEAEAEAPVPPPPERIREEAAGPSTDEVDAKADDFINKFKQQLKLQRLESLMRYKEILNRRL